ncbi:MAG: hypothetical protein KAW00_00575 [Dehalococcoidia bacterium]|nr:hypothetical protein [Dehalococcoidia bacterium]
MVLDKWLNGEEVDFSPKTVTTALDEFEEEAKKIEDLVFKERRYWDAYTRLITCVSFFNTAAQKDPNNMSTIIQRLLAWIREIQRDLNKIVREVGASGYSIGISAPFGVSISLSFAA